MNLVVAAAQSASLGGNLEANVQHHLEFSGLAQSQGAELLLFPELSLTGYELKLAPSCAVTPDSPVLDPLCEFAQRYGMTIVAGAPVPNGRGGLYIGALAFHPDGEVTVHFKQYLHSSEEPPFTSGPGGETIAVGGASIALAICRDATFPEHADAAVRRGATVYAVGAMIDGGGYRRKALLLEAFAAKHRIAVMLANYAGITGGERSAGQSAIWAPGGELVSRSDGNGEELVVGVCREGSWSGYRAPMR